MNDSLQDGASIARALANAFAVAAFTAMAFAIIMLVASASARADQDLAFSLRTPGTEAGAAGNAALRCLSHCWKWYTRDSLYPTYGGR